MESHPEHADLHPYFLGDHEANEAERELMELNQLAQQAPQEYQEEYFGLMMSANALRRRAEANPGEEDEDGVTAADLYREKSQQLRDFRDEHNIYDPPPQP